jgi:hypothetical protein
LPSAALQFIEERLLRRIGMDDGEAMHLVAVIERVHDAPGAKGRKRHSRHGFQSLLLVERPGEPVAFSGEKGGAPPRHLGNLRCVLFAQGAQEQPLSHLALKAERELSLC